jgi:hypothetical protein
VPKEINLGDIKRALVRVNHEAVLSEACKHQLDMTVMLAWVSGVDEQVVQVDNQKHIMHIFEYVVHERLEGRGGVGETKGHHIILKAAKPTSEGGFPLIALTYAHQVVSVRKVEARVNAGFGNSIDEVRDEWEQVSILFSNVIQPAVIDT